MFPKEQGYEYGSVKFVHSFIVPLEVEKGKERVNHTSSFTNQTLHKCNTIKSNVTLGVI